MFSLQNCKIRLTENFSIKINILILYHEWGVCRQNIKNLNYKIFLSCWKETVSETIIKLKRSKNQAALETENGKMTLYTHDFEIWGNDISQQQVIYATTGT